MPQLNHEQTKSQDSLIKEADKEPSNLSVEGPNADICQNQIRKLKKHRRIHVAKRPYNYCSRCKKSLSTLSNLRKRMKHTGEKLYNCSECEKRFFRLWDLKTHMQSHTGVKPYNCSACKKSYAYSSSLKTPMKIHASKKPYSCSICGKSFFHKYHLKNHINIHNKLFNCPTCKHKHSHQNTF